MKKRRIPLYRVALASGTIRKVNAVLKSGWLTTGPKVAEFEKAVAAYAGVRYGAAVSSATIGLQLALEAVGAGPGGQVITSPYTFVATVEAILRTGAMPIMADIDPVTLNIDPDEVARKITRHTVCVVPIDIAGHQADYSALRTICNKHGLPLIADASHSFGAVCRNKSTARLADAAVHSCHATKNLTTGEGGIVLSRHKVITDRIRLMSLHAMTSSGYQRRVTNRWEYDVVSLGNKGNMSDVHAAIGLGQLAVFDKEQARRSRVAKRYLKHLAPLADYVETPHTAPGFVHAWHLFLIRLHLSRLSIDRNRFIALMDKAGIGCGVHYKPIFEMSFYKQSGLSSQYFPNATYAGRRVVTLPMYPGLKLDDVDYICEQIARIVERYGR